MFTAPYLVIVLAFSGLAFKTNAQSHNEGDGRVDIDYGVNSDQPSETNAQSQNGGDRRVDIDYGSNSDQPANDDYDNMVDRNYGNAYGYYPYYGYPSMNYNNQPYYFMYPNYYPSMNSDNQPNYFMHPNYYPSMNSENQPNYFMHPNYYSNYYPMGMNYPQRPATTHQTQQLLQIPPTNFAVQQLAPSQHSSMSMKTSIAAANFPVQQLPPFQPPQARCPSNMIPVWRFKNDMPAIMDHSYAVSQSFMEKLVSMGYIKEMIMGYVVPSGQEMPQCPGLQRLVIMYNEGRRASALGVGLKQIEELKNQGYVLEEILGNVFVAGESESQCCSDATFQSYITNNDKFFYTALDGQKKIVNDGHYWKPDRVICSLWTTSSPENRASRVTSITRQ